MLLVCGHHFFCENNAEPGLVFLQNKPDIDLLILVTESKLKLLDWALECSLLNSHTEADEEA